MLKIEPLALRLNPDRDFPWDLTAHLCLSPTVTLSGLLTHICFPLLCLLAAPSSGEGWISMVL